MVEVLTPYSNTSTLGQRLFRINSGSIKLQRISASRIPPRRKNTQKIEDAMTLRNFEIFIGVFIQTEVYHATLRNTTESYPTGSSSGLFRMKENPNQIHAHAIQTIHKTAESEMGSLFLDDASTHCFFADFSSHVESGLFFEAEEGLVAVIFFVVVFVVFLTVGVFGVETFELDVFDQFPVAAMDIFWLFFFDDPAPCDSSCVAVSDVHESNKVEVWFEPRNEASREADCSDTFSFSFSQDLD